MRYFCETTEGKFFACIDLDGGSDEPRRLECATKFAAMTVRDRAENGGISDFAFLDDPASDPLVQARATAAAEVEGVADEAPEGITNLKPKGRGGRFQKKAGPQA